MLRKEGSRRVKVYEHTLASIVSEDWRRNCVYAMRLVGMRTMQVQTLFGVVYCCKMLGVPLFFFVAMIDEDVVVVVLSLARPCR